MLHRRIALGLIAGLAVSFLLTIPALAQQPSNDIAREPVTTHFATGHRVDDHTYRAICDSPKNKDHAELCQQWRVAEAADLTVFLSVLQIALGAAGAALLFWTLTSTRRATDAAVRSANAMMDAERPHVLVSEIEITGLRQPPNANGSVPITLKWGFKNYGRSPAMLRNYSVSYLLVDRLPEVPPTLEINATRFVVAVNGGFGSEAPERLLVEQASATQILNDAARFWILVRLEYRDTFNRTHYTRGAYRMIFGPGDVSVRYFPDGPDAYWEHS